MIAHKGREGRRGKYLKMAKNMERLYREGKCRDCSVVVTRMDFAKILGKFTKVKIQYESSSSPKTQKTSTPASPKSNARLKNNENGIVQVNRNAYSKHPVKEILNKRNHKSNEVSTPSRHTNNILKENNVLKRTITSKDKTVNYKLNHSTRKQYAIIFNEPKITQNDPKNELSLVDLLPKLNKSILPSVEWCIDYFPLNEEPKEDKVYDRIAAELEDLMCNEKPVLKCQKPLDKTVDDFPSIMDILNDNTISENNVEQKDQSNAIEFKSNLDSSDVEAMLLGKSNTTDEIKEVKPITQEVPMEVDNTDVNKLIHDVVQSSTVQENTTSDGANVISETGELIEMDNPHSPSILDEALQKGIEEHLPTDDAQSITTVETNSKEEKQSDLENNIPNIDSTSKSQNGILDSTLECTKNDNVLPISNIEEITYVTFKKLINDKCSKTVTCPKNLKYSIKLEDKSVELLGAPKYITSLDDLQVLLQIVNESDLESLHVLH